MTDRPDGKARSILAVDTGGTFTDVLLLEQGTLYTLKVPSTPSDPAEAVLTGVAGILREGHGAYELLHGSTVATNSLLERTGARVVLVTNAGFEDIIEIGRQNRPQLYALVGHRSPPLVSRTDRIGIAGRIGAAGQEVAPVDAAELADLAGRTKGAEALAVALLHSYANASHEEAVAAELDGLDVPLSVSSRLLPEFREYERTSTTVVNAYVAPRMSTYLTRLDRESGAERVRIMGSNGGALSVARATREPVHTVLSGPAGGVVGALAWAKRTGHERIITFDMGGTSTDVSLCPGYPLQTREYQIDGQPVSIPVIDIHTVGAGGGSLARTDAGGALRVGPQSAGAHPGPVCYGLGGDGITVTDAHVWLDRLPVEGFLGGEKTLDRGAIEAPLGELAQRLGTTLEAAAQGVIDVADSAMERALRVISVERGFDPAEFALVAFGGAGGLHVAELSDRLGVSRALIPPDPGLLSAYGMLSADVVREASRTVLAEGAAEGAQGGVGDHLTELGAQAIASLESEGIAPDEIRVERWVDARYVGQSFELRVPADDWIGDFHRMHEQRYGYARHDTPVEAVTLRAVASAPGPHLTHRRLEQSTDEPPTTDATIRTGDGALSVRRCWRSDLRAGHRIEGAAQVLEYSSTTWVPEGWTVSCDSWGVLHLERNG